MIRYRAAWVLPIAQPPIRDGWIAVDGGRVSGTGADGAGLGDAIDLGAVAVLPGLVNAHTHLELSHLYGRVPPAPEFVAWIRGVVSTRRAEPDPRGTDIIAGLARGIAQSVEAGTALVGDISNTLIPVEALARSPLRGVVFNEIIRFNAPEPAQIVDAACQAIDACRGGAGVRVGLAAHAPYSVAPAVFRAIRRAANRRREVPVSVHLSESPAETRFIAHGDGPWRTFLGDVGAWDPAWRPPGATPVQYLDRLGFLDAQTLAVHGVQMTPDDLAILQARGATLVTCPRSNRYTGAGVPPVSRFYASGVRVAVGTDSLASTADLSIFNEIAELRRLAPDVPARALLESATRHGADALGFGADYGTIEPGKRARLLAVRIPDGVSDVEEYLVSGIEPEAIRWIEEGSGLGTQG